MQTLGGHGTRFELMPYFSYGFSHAYGLPGSPSSVVASSWLGAGDDPVSSSPGRSLSSGPGSLGRSSLQPSSAMLVVVTQGSVQVWNGGQNRYLMGSWHVPEGHRIRYAVVGELGDVGVVFSTDSERDGTVGAGDEDDGSTYHVAVVGYVKKKALQSLAWATSVGRLMGNDGMVVEEVEVGEMWRRAAADAPSPPTSAPVGLVSAGGSMFWVVHGDGRCLAYDWVRAGMVGEVRIVGGEIVGVGGGATHPGLGVDAVVPLIVRDSVGEGGNPELGVGIVSLKSLSAVLPAGESRGGIAEVTMRRAEGEGGSALVTCVAVCPRGLRVAIGLASGKVVIRDARMDGQEDLASRTLSLEEWGYTTADIGAVSALAWSPDGKVIAVGNARQGLCVWTTQGCRLFSAMVTSSDAQMPCSPRLMIVGGRSRLGTEEGEEAARGIRGVHTSDETGDINGTSRVTLDEAGMSEMDGSPYVAVSHLAFSSHGSHLIVQSDRYRQMFFEVSFARCFENHAILERHSTPASTSNTAFSFLVGSDRLLLITQQLVIEHVCVPQQYIDSAYPIRLSSLNRTQEDVVVAGVHGLAVYNIPRAKWRLIGDLSQDKSLAVRHLGWVHSEVIVACAKIRGTGRGKKPSAFGAKGVKLLFLPRGHLDASSLLGVHDLPAHLGIPLVMDVSNGRISLVFERGEVYVLRYGCVLGRSGARARGSGNLEQGRGDGMAATGPTPQVVTAIDLDLEYSFDIPFIGGERTRLVNTLRSLSVMKRGDGSMWCLLLWDNGELGRMDLDGQTFSVLAREIDYYWIPETKGLGVQGRAPGRHVKSGSTGSTSSSILGETDTWWWTYGKTGMSLWLEDRCETTAPDPELGFDLEVLPIGVSLEDMSVVGLQHRTHKRRGQCANPALSIDFAPIAERQPVLACLLRRLLLNNRLEEALQLADSYSRGPHFARSMEWLLYTALDAAFHERDVSPRLIDSSSSAERHSSELSKTTELISNFSQFSQLVVTVARKVDASMWPMLFDAAGSPAKLCESSIHNGELDHAAAYLLIVHDVLGATEACRLTIKTLKPALTMSKYSLCANLLLFLGDTANIEDANRLADAVGVPAGPSGGAGYVTWLWNWIAPDPALPSQPSHLPLPSHPSYHQSTSVGAMDTHERLRVDNSPSNSASLTARLHAAVSSENTAPTASSITPLVEVWKLVSKHAWHILDDGNVRELASMDMAMGGVHGGLAALLQTTRHLHACSLGHITPSASLIANALFIAGNEMTSASTTELEEIPHLMQSLLAAGCVNYGLALAIVSSNVTVMRDFAEENKNTWDRLIALISNDVHLCSFASVLMAAGGTASLTRSFTL